MNMKKVLAVVLAVIMAVSAMAITVFAEDVKIPLYKIGDISVAKNNVTITFTIPVYGTYGYFTEGDYFELDIPSATEIAGDFKDYKVTVNGFESLPTDGIHTVFFGHVARDVIFHVEDIKDENGNKIGEEKVVDFPTVIPVDTTLNGTSSIEVVITGNIDATWKLPQAWAFENEQYKVQFYDVDNGEVIDSYSIAKFWKPTISTSDASYVNSMEFVNTATYRDVVTAGGSIWGGSEADRAGLGGAKAWNWDHTLSNKDAILKADTVKLVVELTKPINGRATYVLWAQKESNSIYETNANWWYYDSARKQVAVVTVDGQVNELVFDVPVSALYDYNYGVWNNALAITEEITLRDSVLGQDPEKNNYLVDVADGYYSNGIFTDGSLGDLSWAQYGGGAKYKGNNIIYALGGEAYAKNGIPSWDARYGAGAKDIYLLASTTEEDNVVVEEVEDPVEPSTEEEETVEVEDPAEVEEEDTNPGTGLALAVVPMLVAAVAVVASKRR